MKIKTFYHINILVAAMVSMLIFSCKKDLGNYTYTDTLVPKLDTTGISNSYSIERFSTLTIEPKISFPAADTARLTYKWLIYKTVSGSTTEVPQVRTVAQTRKLSAVISDAIGNYQLELVVTDPKTTLKSNVLFKVSVTADINVEYGLLVLHGTNGAGDVDFLLSKNTVPFATTEKWLKNIYLKLQGMKISGEPKFIIQARRSFTTQNWITIGSSSQLTRVQGFDFSFMRENAGLFQRPNEVINPQAYQYSTVSFYETMVNNNKLYIVNSTDPLGAIFPGAVTGDYSLAPFIAEASSSSLIGVVYDEKKLKFLHPATTNVMVDFKVPASSAQPFDLTNIGKTMIGMERGFSNQTLCFFKDLTGNGRWLYTCNFNKTDDGALGLAKYDMSNLPDVVNAKLFAASEFGFAAFYTTDHDLYLYDYTGTNTAKKAFSFPAAEQITAIKIYKPRPNFNLTASDGRILHVATWDGTVGRLYELAIDPTSGAVNQTVLKKYEGFGKIATMLPKARGNDF
ncbi:PKD-like family lipoprotein [Pedobacter sp. PWIIR3]